MLRIQGMHYLIIYESKLNFDVSVDKKIPAPLPKTKRLLIL